MTNDDDDNKMVLSRYLEIAPSSIKCHFAIQVVSHLGRQDVGDTTTGSTSTFHGNGGYEHINPGTQVKYSFHGAISSHY